MVKKKMNLNVKSVIRKENIKTVLISAQYVNILHMKIVLIRIHIMMTLRNRSLLKA